MPVTVIEDDGSDTDRYHFLHFIIEHQTQLVASKIPELYWVTLAKKLKYEVFDAGATFGIMKVLFEDDEDDDNDDDDNENTKHGWKVIVSKEDGICLSDENQIYLVDHAWTYKTESAQKQLESMPSLVERMANLMECSTEGRTIDQLINSVLNESWRYCQTYSIGDANTDSSISSPLWYIMDEFGSRIQHSDHPSIRAVPFYYVPLQMSFTVFWPIKNMDCEDEVTRDYAEGEQNGDTKKARLLPWQYADLSSLSHEHVEHPHSFFEAFRQDETDPIQPETKPCLPQDRSISVYTDCHLVKETLNDIKFKLVETAKEADVLWYRNHFKDFRELSQSNHPQWVNQFPFECTVNMKILLAIASRRAGGCLGPRWLPLTYDLQTELPQFVSYFQTRENSEKDNYWITKPWNLGRGLGMQITNNINEIIRLRETGPKIVSKYIEDPVLFYRDDVGHVKFDYRYVIILSQVKPLKMYAHKVFWLRFANEPYSLDSFDDYQKHFTVMNYQDEKPLKQVHHDEFIKQFEAQYPTFPWSQIEQETFKALTELFEAASSEEPPKGLGRFSQSRALYAVDLMLKWDVNDKGEKIMQPMVLEVNFSADNTRATQYHPDFYNDVFSAMFCDEIQDRPIVCMT